jgi:hypothetical protein
MIVQLSTWTTVSMLLRHVAQPSRTWRAAAAGLATGSPSILDQRLAYEGCVLLYAWRPASSGCNIFAASDARKTAAAKAVTLCFKGLGNSPSFSEQSEGCSDVGNGLAPRQGSGQSRRPSRMDLDRAGCFWKVASCGWTTSASVRLIVSSASSLWQ